MTNEDLEKICNFPLKPKPFDENDSFDFDVVDLLDYLKNPDITDNVKIHTTMKILEFYHNNFIFDMVMGLYYLYGKIIKYSGTIDSINYYHSDTFITQMVLEINRFKDLDVDPSLNYGRNKYDLVKDKLITEETEDFLWNKALHENMNVNPRLTDKISLKELVYDFNTYRFLLKYLDKDYLYYDETYEYIMYLLDKGII